MAAQAPPPQITASERFTFRLSSAELAQLRAYAAAEGCTPSEAIREALYQHGVLVLTEAGRTRPGASTQTHRRNPDDVARRWAWRYLKRHGYRVLNVRHSLPGLHLLAIDASRVRAIHVADATLETTWPAVDLPPAVSMEQWSINGDDEPHVQVQPRT